MTSKKKRAARPTYKPPAPVAPPASVNAALSRLERAGIAYRADDPHCYWVAETFMFWPATGFWRDKADETRGNGVFALIEAVAALPPGRDSHETSKPPGEDDAPPG